MDVTKIPFAEKVGIVRSAEGSLELPFSHSVQNHVQTLHASAQFTLAETASGEILQISFPELVGKAVPVLRDSQIRFRKPAAKAITAHPVVSDEAISRFKERFAKKGRSSAIPAGPLDAAIKRVFGIGFRKHWRENPGCLLAMRIC
ncbi:MAG: YiiD C-terminal domain-containing protein [Candidatus Nealsonbacteria bacterium]|nr:YiiD C-terminal domain-containing protein [Candidatus Nealsonbacteria bacterium]